MSITQLRDGFLKPLADYIKNTAEEWLSSQTSEYESKEIAEVKPLWSLFKFINKPNLYGLEDVWYDNRLYFTIPLGVLSATGKYHYILFPAGGSDDEIREVSCSHNIMSSVSAEEHV